MLLFLPTPFCAGLDDFCTDCCLGGLQTPLPPRADALDGLAAGFAPPLLVLEEEELVPVLSVDAVREVPLLRRLVALTALPWMTSGATGLPGGSFLPG